MDWKYILKLNPDNLSEDDKDQLLTTIAWSDYEREELDQNKVIALLKVSQEIMKYKAEQVEALLAELDEVAAKQGEEDARKQGSHEDVQSIRSRHTSSTLSTECEQKYHDVKSKLKHQVKTNEIQKGEIEKLQQNISSLKTENLHLQKEIQSILNNEESKSDTSESITDKNKELAHVVKQKNAHISQLLNDIEAVEAENLSAQEELQNLRDKLSDAASNITLMTNDLTSFHIKLKEKSEVINNLTETNEALKSQIQDFIEEKQQREKQIDEFTEAIDQRVDKWKIILQEKDEEIQKLKISVLHSSDSNFSGERLHVETLNKVVFEQESQLTDLQTQLQNATKEMHKSTELIEQLSASKTSCSVRVEEQMQLIKNLKSQLQSAHKRSQDLQDGIQYAENVAESKQDDLNDLITKLKNDGKIPLSESLEEIQKLKLQLRLKNKQVCEYVSISNNLQNALEQLENENTELREKCGIQEDEEVNTTGVMLKKHKQKQELSKLRKQFQVLENENLDLKDRIIKLKRHENNHTQVDSTNTTDMNPQNNIELIEENEALRKGLHEILESIQLKKESSNREIKSDTLEKLLKVLDVRHVSGWYHPAMRLQAELHASQSVNSELREQLRFIRLELSSYQQIAAKSSITTEDSTDKSQQLVDGFAKQKERTNSEKIELLEKPDTLPEIGETQKLYESDKKLWEEKEENYQKQIQTLEDNSAILDAKLREFTNLNEDDYKKVERFAQMSESLVILNRKCVFLENQESKLLLEVKKSVNDKTDVEIKLLEKIALLQSETSSHLSKINSLENLTSNSIDRKIYLEVQNNLDLITLKYRNLLDQFDSLKNELNSDLTILTQTVKTLKEQKSEMYNSLIEALSKIYMHETISVPSDIQVLAKKLAQTETNEITEKQRANHMCNLYNVVKEQLQKSEEHTTNLNKHNQEIKQINTSLQESVKHLEDKLINNIDTVIYQNAQSKLVELSETIQKLTSENEKLKSGILILKKNVVNQSCATSNDMEILNLKHQILDLQASSDDKALIARLSSDVVLARLSETQCQQKLSNVEMELNNCLVKYEDSKNKMDQLKVDQGAIVTEFNQRISTLEEILRNQRQQYLGSIPLISQEARNNHLQQILKDKHSAFISLQTILHEENECFTLKEQLSKQLHIMGDFKERYKGPEYLLEKIKSWQQERNILYIKEIRNEKQLEFKNVQLEDFSRRINMQDNLISKLQEEVIQSYHQCDPFIQNNSIDVMPQVTLTNTPETKSTKHEEIQTSSELESVIDVENTELIVANLQDKLFKLEHKVEEKDSIIEQLKSKIIEVEMNLSLFRTQIGDKQSQINFYEKHILELQNKIAKFGNESTIVVATEEGPPLHSVEEVLTLKDTLMKLQESNAKKDASLLKFQTLLKNDRDEHSLAAGRMQQEVKRLQDLNSTQEKLYKELQETSIKHPGKAAIQQYIHQVHALEKHTDELHTNVSSLNSQLQASRQETVRWQTLANERLNHMDQLRAELEDQHQSEILVYKQDSDRWRDEISKLKQMINKHRSEAKSIEPDLKSILYEKDEKIRELSVSVKQAKNEINRISSERSNAQAPKIIEIESNNDQLAKELQTLKKQYEQLINRERNAKDEVLKLKEQLLKKPISARGDKSEKEQQLQKKINSLEKEVQDLKDKLEKELVITEAHRVTVTEDFEKWKKQKHFQQLSEKLKIKLEEKTEVCEKLNQTCSGYKILIERLEREKHSLENKNKSLRTSSINIDSNQFHALSIENEKLHIEVEELNSKFQMQHYHSGGLGAAMLQEKLEAQERKIAVLELTSKGSVETRSELERLQSNIASLQKLNLRLEAENLEMKLDMEKLGNDAPHLHDRIQHLESYIEVLKSENQSNHIVMECGDHANPKPDTKKISELERTVFVLKRVVEKLQVENKRLQSGSRPCTALDRAGSSEKLMIDYRRLKEQYGESIKTVSMLEDQLKTTSSKIKLLERRPLSTEIDQLSQALTSSNAELAHKSQLLDKVKVLLHRAATREKALVEEINSLKIRIPADCNSPNSV